MAKIILDARESGTSTGRYIDKLVENLHALKPKHEFIILTNPHRLGYMSKIAPDFTALSAPHKEFTFDEQLGFKKQLEELKPDLVHFGLVQQPVLYKGRVVTTIHDLTTVRFRNPDKNMMVFKIKQQIYKMVIKRAARKSSMVITPSEFVKKDVLSFTHVEASKITVTHEAADAIPDKAEAVAGLTGQEFIMYVGRPTPHKNLERLIESFVLLQKDHLELKLVLAGKRDANYKRIEASVAARGLRNVVFTDFLSEGQLRWLYENCLAYVFPSLSEGFGLPGLEAMVHGAPVVSSNATCLPEVYGPAAHYFDPYNVPAMANAINDVLTDRKLRQELIDKGLEQVKKYSWRKMAEQALEVYEKALNEK